MSPNDQAAALAPAADPYAPPAAALADLAEVAPARFYVVATRKFWVMHLGTFGMYHLYWVYRHWAHLKRAINGDEWPVARAIFSVFYIHPLVAEIGHTLKRGSIAHAWLGGWNATGAVLAIVAMRLLDRIPEHMLAENPAMVLTVVLMALAGLFLWRIQLAANAACEDPEGAGNARFSVANFLWLVPFALVWTGVALVLTGAVEG